VMYRFLRLLAKVIVALMRTRVRGRENLSFEGSAIIISNHLQLRDPPILIALFKRKIHFIAKVELFRNPFLRFILTSIGTFPVKRGMSDIKAVRRSLDVLRAGGVLGIFPEGKRSRTGEMQEFEPGVAMFALKTGAKVIPVAIHEHYTYFRRPPRVTIGEPLDMSRFEGMKRSAQTNELVTRYMYESVLALKNRPWEEKR